MGLSDLIASIIISSRYDSIFVPKFLATWRKHDNRIISNTYTHEKFSQAIEKINKILDEYNIDKKIKDLLLFKILKNYYLSNKKINKNILKLLTSNKKISVLLSISSNLHNRFKYVILFCLFLIQIKIKSLFGHLKSRFLTFSLSLIR